MGTGNRSPPAKAQNDATRMRWQRFVSAVCLWLKAGHWTTNWPFSWLQADEQMISRSGAGGYNISAGHTDSRCAPVQTGGGGGERRLAGSLILKL